MTTGSAATAHLRRTGRTEEAAQQAALRCPHCRCEVGHHDRRGGRGYILTARYLRLVPHGQQIMLACPKCRQEFRAGQLVVENRVGG